MPFLQRLPITFLHHLYMMTDNGFMEADEALTPQIIYYLHRYCQLRTNIVSRFTVILVFTSEEGRREYARSNPLINRGLVDIEYLHDIAGCVHDLGPVDVEYPHTDARVSPVIEVYETCPTSTREGRIAIPPPCKSLHELSAVDNSDRRKPWVFRQRLDLLSRVVVLTALPVDVPEFPASSYQ